MCIYYIYTQLKQILKGQAYWHIEESQNTHEEKSINMNMQNIQYLQLNQHIRCGMPTILQVRVFPMVWKIVWNSSHPVSVSSLCGVLLSTSFS